MWEPHTEPAGLPRLAGSDFGNAVLADGFRDTGRTATLQRGANVGVPPELLVLNRFGIGYPYIRAAAQISEKYGIDGRDVLLRAGIISEEIWRDSNRLLERERMIRRQRMVQENFLLNQAVSNLHKTLPHFSAKRTFTAAQILFLASVCLLLVSATVWGNDVVRLAGMLVATAFYTSLTLLRAFLLAGYDGSGGETTIEPTVTDAELPVYSVLVPLYRESNLVEDLVRHLACLNWPTGRLEIKLICERDDPETLSAVKRCRLPGHFELIIVPDSLPRTKPKALNYALPTCRGEFLVIYDAEDRPHPDQLREAFVRFRQEGPELACLQAPLQIRNPGDSLITRMFFIEYMTLFNGVLPVLAKWRLPIPLGGTSNHFRTRILKNIGAWDPFNVTEDADLGIRLFREGYRSATLSRPTLEEAPRFAGSWIKQRTRWIKGWMQTVLVHNRNPFHLLTDLGFVNCAGFHLMLTSIVVSALVHPVFAGATLFQLYRVSAGLSVDPWVLGLGFFNLAAGYSTYGLFAFMVLKVHRYNKYAGSLIFMPLYWLMISVAGWRALFHLLLKPHHWEKTAHGLEREEDDTTAMLAGLERK